MMVPREWIPNVTKAVNTYHSPEWSFLAEHSFVTIQTLKEPFATGQNVEMLYSPKQKQS
jgi:hypothetical protein